MTNFKYDIEGNEELKEIAYQLKRIADVLCKKEVLK
jgi:hypothetical protein